jgi:hypothetical protein
MHGHKYGIHWADFHGILYHSANLYERLLHRIFPKNKYAENRDSFVGVLKYSDALSSFRKSRLNNVSLGGLLCRGLRHKMS